MAVGTVNVPAKIAHKVSCCPIYCVQISVFRGANVGESPAASCWTLRTAGGQEEM